MNRNLLLAALTLCLAVFGSFPALAEPPIHEKATSDPLQNLFDAGWVQVSSGVLTRDLGHGKVEVLGLGAEGLRYRLQEMRKHLRHLKATYDEHPTPELKDSLRAYRTEIRRLMERLETAKSVDELDSATQAAGIDCTINYGAHVNAFPLSGSAQGVGANADSYFNSNCGQIGEVLAHAYGEGRRADNSFWTVTKTDGPYTGPNVRAAASITLNVIKECFSHAYASMTSYDIGVTYAQSANNYTCPPPPLYLSVTSSDADSKIYVYSNNLTCVNVTWTAAASGGNSPYSYSWSTGTTGSTYTKCFRYDSTKPSSYTFSVTATATDSSSPVQTKSQSHTVTVYNVYVEPDPIDPCYITSDGKALPACP